MKKSKLITSCYFKNYFFLYLEYQLNASLNNAKNYLFACTLDLRFDKKRLKKKIKDISATGKSINAEEISSDAKNRSSF